MSGIAVIHMLDGRPAPPDLLTKMLDAIAHRAVDGQGRWSHGATAMGCARMWTTPEAVPEPQPYCAGSGEAAICLAFDGRVDNRVELRRAVAAAGVEPQGDSDAELIMCAWHCWGEQSPRKVIGDFAYVLWDGPQRRLFCARDASGMRPLFYYCDSRLLLCGSELHQLLECPAVPREPNAPVIADYLCDTFTSADETLLRHVRRLPPAHYLIADQRGVRVNRYYDLDPVPTIRYAADEQYAEHFLEVFKEAVRCRLRMRTPAAAELSGGLDSSSVVATIFALQREGLGPATPLQCFSIAYDEPECDERQYAEEVARAGGVDCNFVAPTPLDYAKCLEQVRRYRDLPDYVNGAVFDGLREELVHRGLRVVLTGLGGDQWLHGSDYYLCDFIRRCQWRELVRHLHSDCRFGRLTCSRDRLQVLLRWGIKPLLPKPIVRLARRLLGRPLYPYSVEPAFAREVGLAARLERQPPCPPGVSFAQRSIYESWASPWMFHVLEMDERSNAWAGVEGRHPFYDRRVLEFAFAIPELQRARLELTKVVLRNAMTGLLPESVRHRRTKARFDRIFVETFNRLGGEHLFETMALETQRWVSARRMKQLCRERLAASSSNLWPLWTAFAIELWFRVMFATPPVSVRADQTGPSMAAGR